jgi:hypothetical protein
MKKVCITYHLYNNYSNPSDEYPHKIETAENCITTSFTDEIAQDIIDKQRNSKYVLSMGSISIWLNLLAELQGYQNGYFVVAEEEDL